MRHYVQQLLVWHEKTHIWLIITKSGAGTGNWNLLYGKWEPHRTCRTVRSSSVHVQHGQNLVKRSNCEGWKLSSFGRLNMCIVLFYYAYVMCMLYIVCSLHSATWLLKTQGELKPLQVTKFISRNTNQFLQHFCQATCSAEQKTNLYLIMSRKVGLKRK